MITMAQFPTEAWVEALMVKLNTDKQYAQIARKWEGDILFEIVPDDHFQDTRILYLDLWHGKCRAAYVVCNGKVQDAAFTLTALYSNYVKLLNGEIDPMQALLTRKLGVKGNMAVLMRSVPTVLDFVRCCREITDSFE